MILRDEGLGEGPYIAKWNLANTAQPTQADLDQWAIDLQSNYTFQQNKIANQPIYDKLDALDLKSVRALRENDTTRLSILNTEVAALRATLLAVV